MSPPTVAIVVSGSPGSSQPPSPKNADSPVRPSLGARSASWSAFQDYALPPRGCVPTVTEPGEMDTSVAALVEPTARMAGMSLGLSREISPKNSLDLGRAPPSPNLGAVTPLSAMDKVFNVPASEGLSDRLKELAKQTDTTVLEVLRRLSEAERQSSLVKACSTKDELRAYFATFVTMSDVSLEACFRLNLPIGTWEHVAEQLLSEDRTGRTDLATALYWRARHRGERMERYRTTGRTSG